MSDIFFPLEIFTCIVEATCIAQKEGEGSMCLRLVLRNDTLENNEACRTEGQSSRPTSSPSLYSPQDRRLYWNNELDFLE